MKITDIRPIAVSGGNFRDWVLVEILTDEGISGLGEATLEGKPNAIVGAITDLRDILLGADPTKIENIWQTMYRGAFWRGGPVLNSAISGVDIALWDIFGKVLSIPVYKLLGGECRDKIKVYANGWADGCSKPEEFADKALQAVGQGFRSLKFSPFGPTASVCAKEQLREVLKCIEAVRDAVGPEIELAVDLHGRINPTTTVTLLKELEAFDLWFIEEPSLPENIRSLQKISALSRVPVATGERLFTKWGFVPVLENRLVDIIQPDLCHVGGISEAKKIASMAEAYYISVAPHNPLSHVSTVACLHLDANIPNFLAQEVVVNDVPWRGELVNFDVKPVNGYVNLPSGPGLGINLNYSVVKAHPAEGGRPPVWFHIDGSLADW
jgi:galactonate dehydratase